MQSLFQNIQAAIVVHGPDTKIIKCNKLSQDLLGLTEDQMLEKRATDPLWRFLNEDGSDLPLAQYPVNQVIATKNPLKNFIAGIYRPNKNDIVNVLVNAVPMLDHDGNIAQVVITFTNVTELKQVEEKLRENEIKLKTLVNNIPGMVYRAYADWSAEVISGSEQVCGYTNEELNSKKNNWLTIIHPDDKENIFKQGSELAKRKQEAVQTYRIITKKGDIRWVEDRKTSIFSEEGKFVGIDGIVLDITDRKKVGEALKESESQFRSLVELTSDWIWEVDNNGNYTYASPKCEALLGFKPNDLIGKTTPFHFMPADEAERIGGLFKAIVAARESFHSLENINIHKDGHHVVLETSGVPFFDEDGNLIGYRGVDRDITERKQVEEKLQKSEERYRFLAENMADIVFTFDMGMNVTYVSPSIKKVLGFTPEERKQQTLEEMVTPDSLERLTAVFVAEIERDKQAGVDPDRSVVIETENYHKNGSTVWLENIVKAIRNKEGHMIGIYGAARNITNRKSVEDSLKQEKKRLEKAIAEIKKLSGLLPICASCKKIRDDKGYWNQIESYIHNHSEAQFSHSICPECAKKLYPDLDIIDDLK